MRGCIVCLAGRRFPGRQQPPGGDHNNSNKQASTAGTPTVSKQCNAGSAHLYRCQSCLLLWHDACCGPFGDYGFGESGFTCPVCTGGGTCVKQCVATADQSASEQSSSADQSTSKEPQQLQQQFRLVIAFYLPTSGQLVCGSLTLHMTASMRLCLSTYLLTYLAVSQ